MGGWVRHHASMCVCLCVCVCQTDTVMCLNIFQNNKFYLTSCSCLVKKKILPDMYKCKPLFVPVSHHGDFPETQSRIKTHPAGERSEAAPERRCAGESSSTDPGHIAHHLHCFKSVWTKTTTAFKTYLMAEGRERKKCCGEMGWNLREHCPLLLYFIKVFVRCRCWSLCLLANDAHLHLGQPYRH